MSRVCCLCADLMFASKINATARAVAVDVRIVRETAQLLDAIDSAVQLVIVDLFSGGSDPVAAIAAVTALEGAPEILAYCPHVDGDLAQAARAAGAQEVWPRSRFANEVERVLVDGRLSLKPPLQ